MSERYPPHARAWYAVGVLYLAYLLAFVDRQIISFLVAPIRADLAITDFEFSLINGLAFAIFYALLGVSLLMPVVGGLYLRRAGPREALASLAAGNLTLLAVRALPAPSAWIDPTVAGLIASAAAFLITYALRRDRI